MLNVQSRGIYKLAVALVVLLTFEAPSASADESRRALHAFNVRDYATAGELFLKYARAGRSSMYPLLGQFYKLGTGRPKDLYEAVYWTRKSNEPRDIEWVRNASIVLPDTDEAVAALYLEQAATGDTAANYRAALVTEAGRGVEKDQAAAFEYHLRAAQAGHAYAQLAVAIRYFGGVGVAEDQKEAAIWMRKASDQGLPVATHYMADFLMAGLGVTPNPTQAEALYKAGAENGYGQSQMLYGAILFKKAEKREDRVESLKWMLLAMPLLPPVKKRVLENFLKSISPRIKDPTEISDAQQRAKAFVRNRPLQ